jgi:lactate dehydrogenase-like 2-hydroxyacid dehydrogenase
LLLSTFRDFPRSSRSAREPALFTDAHRNIAAVSHNPSGHTLGIIGLGKIGYRIAEKAHLAFGMNIIYHDIARKLPTVEMTVGAKYYERLTDMLPLADCVVLATPFEGKIIFHSKTISKMKYGSRFVNIARGKLVDEDALASALESGQIAAAGLDVHFNEPNVNKRLAKMDKVEMLSHTAGAALESHIGFERLGIENILSFFQTGKALSPVNLHEMTPARL